MKKVMLAFATLALAVVSAETRTYHVKIYDPVWAGGTELKSGEYTVEVNGDKAVFKSGKTVVEVPAKLEQGESKFNRTSVRMDGEKKIKDIEFGGSKSRIVLQSGGVPTGE
jgi:hypothetical protein